jgi:hypothetical protein
MVKAVAALIDFCYLVRRNIINETALMQIQTMLERFHQHQEIFHEVRTCPDGFSLPRQHSLMHYVFSITRFGAPNGLCSSITESKHIKAVKRPYRRSGKNKPLGQMLITNQRVDKLAGARTFLTSQGSLNSGPSSTADLLGLRSSQRHEPQANSVGPLSAIGTRARVPDPDRASEDHHTPVDEHEGPDSRAEDDPEAIAEISLARTRGAHAHYSFFLAPFLTGATVLVRNLPQDLYLLSQKIRQPDFPLLVRRFLFAALNPDSPPTPTTVDNLNLPDITENIYVYNSARVVYYAPSDISGLKGMHRERIRSTQSWYGGRPRRDCVFIAHTDSQDAPGFRGLLVARVYLFFSFKYQDVHYPCALVHWFSTVGDTPDDETNMWIVGPDYLVDGAQCLEVIHLDSILRGAHLIGVAGVDFFLPSHPKIDSLIALDSFKLFYVNKYADHHAHEIAF